MRLLTAKQAADLLSLSVREVRRLCGSRSLRHCRIGTRRGALRIPEDGLRDYVESRSVEPVGARPLRFIGRK